VGVSIASFRHEPESFPERDTLDGGIKGHYTNPLERTFEQGQGDLAPNTSPTKNRAHVEAPHPQRIRDDRIDGNTTDGSPHACRIRGEQAFTRSIETHRARRPILRESIEKPVTFGSGLRPYGVEISG
jgi:hypothetical protein